MSVSNALCKWGNLVAFLEGIEAQLSPWWRFDYNSAEKQDNITTATIVHTILPLKARFKYTTSLYTPLRSKRAYLNDTYMASLGVLKAVGEVMAQAHWSVMYLWPDADLRMRSLAHSYAAKSFQAWHPDGENPENRHEVFDMLGQRLITILAQMQKDNAVYPITLHTWEVPPEGFPDFLKSGASLQERLDWHPYHTLQLQPVPWGFSYQ